MEKLAEQIIDDLRGTCTPLYEALGYYGWDEEDMSLDFFQTIDDAIFLCDTCGWWDEACNQYEDDGFNICHQCFEEVP